MYYYERRNFDGYKDPTRYPTLNKKGKKVKIVSTVLNKRRKKVKIVEIRNGKVLKTRKIRKHH
jgi:hypothetical protein